VDLHDHGWSQRMIADVFDLPHSRVHAIIAEFRAKYGAGAAS
jgi:DNA-directed RNA polymerase specialized sigma24 family protein